MTIKVAIINTKGGAGKTTIATNLASMLKKLSNTVAIIDLDPQGSATQWAAQNEREDAVPVYGMAENITRDIDHLRGFDYILIDGAPHLSKLSAAATKAADIVLIPVQPSYYDIWACEDLVDLVKARQEVTDGKPLASFVISRAIKNSTLSREASRAVEGFGLPCFKNCTVQRVVYINTVEKGGSVADLSENDHAYHETKMLAKELMELAKCL